MELTTTQVILAELREIRGEMQQNQIDVVQRLASLEAQMKSLLGNGQPGRIGALESAISAVNRFKYTVVGYAMGVAGLVSLGTTLLLIWVTSRVR